MGTNDDYPQLPGFALQDNHALDPKIAKPCRLYVWRTTDSGPGYRSTGA